MSKTLAFLTGLALILAPACNTEHQHVVSAEPRHGYDVAGNWDQHAEHITVDPAVDVNPVRTQHVLVATVTTFDGAPLGGRRVEWMIPEGGVGAIVEVDQHGVYNHKGQLVRSSPYRSELGEKYSPTFAVTHTNNRDELLDMGNDDPADDIVVKRGQTWISITSATEGTTDVIAYAPGIRNWADHKAFARKHWMDATWTMPGDATNRVGEKHPMMVTLKKQSDGTPLAGYAVTYTIDGGPGAVLDPGGKQSVTVKTNAKGEAAVTLRQTKPVVGKNPVLISIVKPANEACCEPEEEIAAGNMTKTWVSPGIAISKTAPAKALGGQTFKYTIVTSTTNDLDTRNAVVTDVLPAGISYVSSTPSATVSGQKLTWNLGTIPGGGSKTITVNVKGAKPGTYRNCAEVKAEAGLQASDCAETVITAPALALTKTVKPESMICDGVRYTLVVSNPGDAPAQNVKITDNLPAGLTASGGSSAVSIDVGTLPAGGSKTFTVKANASKPGTFSNTAKATGDGGLTASASAKTTVRQPVLTIVKKAPARSFIGRPITYTVTVANTGDAVAADVTLVDRLPAGAKFASASDGGSSSGSTVRWLLGDMAPKASKTVTVKVTTSGAGTLVNRVTAEGVCAAEVAAETTTIVEGIPALLLEVVDVDDPIEVGANETYVIVVTNQGSADGHQIGIKATFPAEMSFVTASGPTSHTLSGRTITFAPLGSLAPKKDATYRVTVKANAEGDVRFAVQMTSAELTSPVDETEATRLY